MRRSQLETAKISHDRHALPCFWKRLMTRAAGSSPGLFGYFLGLPLLHALPCVSDYGGELDVRQGPCIDAKARQECA